jgi:hypothetical protein
MAAKSIQLKHLNLSREGAALQKSVWAELGWVRRAVRSSQTGQFVETDGGPAKAKTGKKKSTKKK